MTSSNSDPTGLTENQVAVAAGIAVAKPTQIGARDSDGYVLPDFPAALAFLKPEGASVEVVDLEDQLGQYRERPTRKTGRYYAHDADSFVAYMAKHKLPQSEVWSDAQAQKIVAVINAHLGSTGDGAEDYAGYGDHRVEYQVKLTDAWKAWTAHDGKLLTQVAFAEHIENRMVDIIVPDAADLLELAQSFEATTSVAFESGNVLASGERQLVFRETIEARAGRSGQMTIPKEFVIALQPFENSLIFELTARLRHRIRDGALTIGYQLVRPDDVLKQAFVSVSDQIKAGVDPTPVYLGVSA